MKKRLYEFQSKALEQLIGLNRNKVFLMFEQGLGKTITSLEWFSRMARPKLLIICQRLKREDWKEEVQEYLGLTDIRMVSGKPSLFREDLPPNSKRKLDYEYDVVIITHRWVTNRTDLEIRALFHNRAVIIDESQNYKGTNSKSGKKINSVSEYINEVILLSGTPMSQGYIDIYRQLHILGLKMTLRQFKDAFVIQDNTFGYIKITGYRNTHVLNAVINGCSAKCRAIDAIDLPAKVFIDVKYDLGKAYKYLSAHSAIEYVLAPTPGVKMNYERQLSSGNLKGKSYDTNKLERLEQLLAENPTSNYVLFYNFIDEKESILKSEAIKSTHKMYELSGQKDERHLFLDQDSCEPKMLLIQYAKGATGTDGLQHISNRCIIYSPPLSYAMFDQAVTRLMRIGQSQKTFYYLFKGRYKWSVELHIYKALENKRDYTLQMYESKK